MPLFHRNIARIDSSAAIIITRPPEIVACIKLKLSRSTSIFLVFDSHPRVNHPDGLGITVASSLEVTARKLAEIFPVCDLPESDWQALLLAHYSGHVFVPHFIDDREAYLTQIALESSLTLLSQRAENATLASRNTTLVHDVRILEAQVEILEDERRQERSRKTSISSGLPRSSAPPTARFASLQPEAGPSPIREPVPSTSTSCIRESETSSFVLQSSVSDADIEGSLAALEQQRLYDSEDALLRQQQLELMNNAQRSFDCQVCFETYPEDVVLRVETCGHGFCRDCMKSFITSKIEEHRFPIFCPVCTASGDRQTKPGGMLVTLFSARAAHATTEAIAITQDLITCVDLTEEQYTVWTDMQMATLSTIVHCRKYVLLSFVALYLDARHRCRNSLWIDKQDFNEAHAIVCPLRGCQHAWCKDCQQTIEVNSGPRHSCDGSSELDHLARKQGWKYCPSELHSMNFNVFNRLWPTSMSYPYSKGHRLQSYDGAYCRAI
jgi:hypothetical protein